MTDQAPDISRDLQTLFELSLAVGRSLDPDRVCADLLEAMLRRKGLAYAAVWVRGEVVDHPADPGFRLLYALPRARARAERLPADHGGMALAEEEEARGIDPGDPGFAAWAAADGIDGGGYALFRLGDLGRLKLYRSGGGFTQREIRQLRPIAEKLRVAMEGALAHRRLARQRALLRSLIDSVPDLIFFKDRDSVYLGCNRAFARYAGRSEDQLIGRSDLDLFPREVAERYQAKDREMLRSGKGRRNEEWIDYPDGRRVLLDTLKTPFYGPAGDLLGLIGVGRDITAEHEAREALRNREEVYRSIVSQAPDAIGLIDVETGRFVEFNEAAHRYLGYTREEFARLRISDLEASENPEEVAVHFRKILTDGGDVFETRHRHKDGTVRDLRVSARPLRIKGQEYFTAIWSDITEQKAARGALDAQRRFLRSVLDAVADPVLVIDADYRVRDMNNAARDAMPHLPRNPSADGTLTCHWLSHGSVAPCSSEEHPCPLRQVIATGKPVRVIHRHFTLEGERVFELSASPFVDEHGAVAGIVEVSRDITDRLEAEQRIQFLAHHDPLTGLPNRVLARDRFEQAVSHAVRESHKVALLFLDLDHFKTINDTLGHQVGDGLLQRLVQRLRGELRETDTLSRQGGDELLILLDGLQDEDGADLVARHLLDAMATSFEVEGHQLHATLSIGISLFPDDGSDFDTLLQKADTAMYSAKEAGRNAYRFFTDAMNLHAVERMQIQSRLRLAMERNELRLHFQPQVDMDSGRILGAEALLRWHTEDLGMVPPARFIPVAEDSGLILPIGAWVLGEACREARSWQRPGHSPVAVAVNLSALQFRRGDLVATVAAALADSGLDPRLLELEITESILLRDTEAVLATVDRLKALGVRLAIDDFGTGYSSLGYLKRFAVDRLKIDQSFIRDMVDDPDDAAIVRAIVQMAHSLKLAVIAEGVEHADQARRLRAEGCGQAQGYFYARPMEPEALAALLDRDHGILGQPGLGNAEHAEQR